MPGLPDMVYAANGATVVDGTVLAARFRHPQRAAEAVAHATWFRRAAARVVEPEFVNEGEGDLLVVGDLILAGHGFRTDPRAHAEAARVFGREVVSLELVDPRYYHLDTAVAVLDATTIAWLPEAFRPASRAVLQERFPDAVVADAADAAVLGLNAVSDGRHVVLPVRADPAGRRGGRARVRPRPRRPVRAAQGRRRTEVLHAGGALMTSRRCRAAARAAVHRDGVARGAHGAPLGAQLPPAARWS